MHLGYAIIQVPEMFQQLCNWVTCRIKRKTKCRVDASNFVKVIDDSDMTQPQNNVKEIQK